MTAHLIGREAELRRIRTLLDAGHGALLLRGGPGAGKTALLDAAARATRRTVLRADAVGFEQDIPFAAVHQLVYPLSRDPIGTARDPLAVATRVLALLDEAAARGPLLLIVDDVPRVDAGSAAVLGFAVRRLRHDVVVLASARTGAASCFDELRIPVLDVPPLPAAEAGALLDARRPGLAPAVHERIMREADGNPLALLELATALTDRQVVGADPMPDPPHLSPRLFQVYSEGLHDLAPDARDRLLDAALDTWPSGSPLERAAVVQLATPAERRAAHRRIAETLTGDPSRRVWHLAEAADAPDESLAVDLQRAARAAQRNGSAAAAVTALVRASELSPEPADRFRRLMEAASLASVTGPLERATQLLEEARRGGADPDGSAFTAAAVAIGLIHGDGDIDTGQRMLADALDRADPDGPDGAGDWVGDALHGLLIACEYGARPELWQLLDRAVHRFQPEGITPLRLCFDALTDPASPPYPVREAVIRIIDELSRDVGSWYFAPLAYAALRVDALSGFRHAVERMVERERGGGGYTFVISGLLLLGVDASYHGRWAEAERSLSEGLDLAVAHGYRLFEVQLRSHLAFLAAARGDVERCRVLTDGISAWAAPRGVGLTQAFVRRARAVAALGQGDFEEAYVQASLAAPDGPSAGIPARWMVMDLVEAAVRTGRPAEQYVAAARRSGIPRISPRTALLTAGAAALAAPDEEADTLFRAALALPEADRWPFDQARIQLAYGEWLRRTRSTGRARLQLRAALDTLDRLGATPWAQRARNELRATGVGGAARVPRQSTAGAALTFQERQIASLAATGLTNKQIGEKLFLSHRTVGAHLHRVFPKLGITSRAALHDALQAVDAATAS
ncbi:LuxR C-terminal-related transcriptional regulator [Dactylosporangium sucinum]|uniref:LuxR family transcriptional regulator n=1 Tax=Dactylosporangium sucinum TaxID=1424081 RepID=A0A917X0K2_9ACTN|nr:LuxR family transcriptional regulator [Dactylosporangium sucinum]GGM54399.1 LuxR family transcriptional regulator [Dactylosporangium sucinum]